MGGSVTKIRNSEDMENTIIQVIFGPRRDAVTV
jgi:hypothetical protein